MNTSCQTPQTVIYWLVPENWEEKQKVIQKCKKLRKIVMNLLKKDSETKNKWEDLTTDYSVAQSCPALCDPMDCSMPGFPLFHCVPELAQSHVHWVDNHPILCCPLFLRPSIVPSIRVFPSELVLRLRWPKYWNFSFSISPSNEYLGLTSFSMDWLDLCAD